MTEGCRALPPDTARSRRFHRQWVLVVLATLSGAAMWSFVYVRDRMAELPELRTVSIERGDLRLTVKATGTVEPEDIVEVGATVAGKIVEFASDADSQEPIDVGSRVAKNCALLQLDRQLYEVELQKAQAARRLVEAELGRLTTQLNQATREWERAERLRGTNSQSDFDKIVTAREAAAAELAVGRARLERAIAEERQAEINLEKTTIRSPIDGVVLDRRANLGQNVGAGSSGLFLLTTQLDQLRIRATVSETDVGKVRIGQPVTFTVDAHRDRTMTGRVKKIFLNARLHGNFVTYDVLIAADSPTTTLLPHMTADVEFETVKREQAWLVPSSSLGWWPSPEQIAPAYADITRPIASAESQTGNSAGEAAVIWVPTDNDQVRPMPIRVGINDGMLAEVVGEGFREELPVVVGTVKKTALARIIPSVKTIR